MISLLGHTVGGTQTTVPKSTHPSPYPLHYYSTRTVHCSSIDTCTPVFDKRTDSTGSMSRVHRLVFAVMRCSDKLNSYAARHTKPTCSNGRLTTTLIALIDSDELTDVVGVATVWLLERVAVDDLLIAVDLSYVTVGATTLILKDLKRKRYEGWGKRTKRNSRKSENIYPIIPAFLQISGEFCCALNSF